MTRLPAARFADALAWWQLHAAWWSPDAAVPVRRASGPPGFTWWHRGPRADLASTVRRLDERFDDEIHVGLPHDRPGTAGVARASLLWCRVDGPEQLRRANAFRPRPAIVFSEGASRRLLFWPLEEAVYWPALLAANKRIAYRLRAVQKHGDPDELVFCAPGTCVRVGRARPVPVRVARLTVDSFELQQVVGRLKDPPAQRWWERAG